MPSGRKLSFFISGVLLAVGALIWQQKLLNPTETAPPRLLHHLPQWQGKDAVIWVINIHQKTRTLVVADSLTHHKHPQRTMVSHPRGIFYNMENEYHFEAREGFLQPDQLTLKQKVHAEQHNPDQPSTHLYSNLLSFIPSLNRLSSPLTVKITQEKNWVTGSGLTLDIQAQTFELQHDVISHYAQD